MKAAAHHQIQIASQKPIHRPQHRFWFVLAVGIHHHGHLTAGGQQAFADGAGEAASANAANQMNPWVLPRQLAGQLRGAIR